MKEYIAILFVFILFFVIISGCVQQGDQLPNPAAVFCESKDFTYEIRTNPDGSQTGYCVINKELECDAWAFYYGRCPTCEAWCKTQPHVMCVGHWEISGTYPECNCKFVCEEGEVV